MATSQSSASATSKAIGAVILMAFGLLVTLVVLEGTLRLVPSLLPEGAQLRLRQRRGAEQAWYVPHPYIGHLHMPDGHASARTGRPGLEAAGVRDPWGFRNRWPWPEPVDILAVGDSLTYSQMVDDEQAWTALLPARLPHLRIVNLGLIGGAPQQYLRLYETFGLALAPKVLLVGLFLGNDLWGAQQFDRWWAQGGKGGFPEFGRRDPPPGVRGWIRRRLQDWYLVALWQEVRAAYGAGRVFSGRTIELPSGERLQMIPSSLRQTALAARPGTLKYALVLDTVERIAALAQQHQTHCLILFFPSKEEVYLPLVETDVPDLAASFIPALQQRGIAYLNLTPPFRAHAMAGEKLFFEEDGHPNQRGYALIAELVLAYLTTHAQRVGLGG
jgi:lysophospholipase L1-like esterase